MSHASADLWDRRYESEGYVFGTEPADWLRAHAAALPAAGRALCVADGEGRNSVWLAERGLTVEAFDVSEVGVAKARALAEERGVEVAFTVAGVDDHAWPEGTCDAVVAIFVQFADPELRARMFARMAAALAPGGVLLLHGYTVEQLQYGTGGPPYPENLYTVDLLAGAFPGLTVLELEAYVADVQEGPGHSGMSALIGLIARRPA